MELRAADSQTERVSATHKYTFKSVKLDQIVIKRVVRMESNKRAIIRLVKFLSAPAADTTEIFPIMGAWTDDSSIMLPPCVYE